jgi:isocitrate/isopropylmalate dehydrogenase
MTMLDTSKPTKTAHEASEPAGIAKIVVARGDGIGPEIMDATLRILSAAGAKLDIAEIKVGRDVYLAGNSAGIEESSWESAHHHPARRRLQKPQRNNAQVLGAVRQHSSLHCLRPIRCDTPSGNGHRHHS